MRTAEDETDTEHTSYTYQHREIFNIGYYVRCSYDDALSKYRPHRDSDCISWFVKELEELAHCVKTLLSINVLRGALSREQWKAHHNATHCHICEKPFTPDDTWIRHHCHLTGRYRSPAHSNCNLNYKNSFYIPIVFHNLSGYDSHFSIKEIATIIFEGKIDRITND